MKYTSINIELAGEFNFILTIILSEKKIICRTACEALPAYGIEIVKESKTTKKKIYIYITRK